ncbi:hypothetical protein [Nocardia sp. CDC153]|uniref:hypothetical protein n=1 Tax=Nocardia sp. CDC153 TaxID=3112167 RepID=UPI003FA3A4D2
MAVERLLDGGLEEFLAAGEVVVERAHADVGPAFRAADSADLLRSSRATAVLVRPDGTVQTCGRTLSDLYANDNPRWFALRRRS